MPSCLQRQEHLHLDSVSIQLSVSIYIISVNLHAFLFSNYRSALLNFACYCILLDLVFAEWFCGQRAEIRDNNMIRSAEYEEQSQIRSRSNEGCQSIFFFGATMVSLRGDVADVGILMMSRNMLSQQSRYELPRSPRLLAVYMMWVRVVSGNSDYLADPSSIL